MDKDVTVNKDQTIRGSVAPYILGWFLGVPGSLLFFIFILRGCH
jgi:hypothetical protein